MGRKNGNPGPSSKMVNSPSSLPSLRWSRFLASSSIGSDMRPARSPWGRRCRTPGCSMACCLHPPASRRPVQLVSLTAFEAAGAHQVRAGAQVGEFALLVEADGLALVRVFFGQAPPYRARPCPPAVLTASSGGELEFFQGQALFDDLLHLPFDLFQVLREKRVRRHVKVVVEPVVDGGADGEFGVGIQPLHRLGQHMGAGVPKGVLAVRVVRRSRSPPRSRW